jgi:hypothetical protein
LHHYYVVSATYNGRATMNCPVFDISGEPISGPDIPEKKTSDIAIARFTLDFDRTIFLTGYDHMAKARQIVKDHPNEVTIEKSLPQEGWFIMKAIGPGVSVRELARRAGLPTLMETMNHDREELARRRGSEFK